MSSLPWFEIPLDKLGNAARSDKLPHALLLAVPPGWGTEALLSSIAEVVLGRGPREGQSLQEFADPDFHWVRSVDKEGESSIVIQVDAIRALNDFVTTRAVRGRHKLVIIPQAHRMNLSAANALLKTLEEPASDTCLVLETSQAGRLLPTLRSRCQRLPLSFPRSQAEAWLVNQGSVDAIPLLDLAGGGPFAAIELSRQRDGGINGLLRQLSQDVSPMAILDMLARSEQLPELLRQWYRFTVTRIAGSGSGIEKIRLLAFADELVDCLRQIDGVKGANSRLLLDRLLFLWAFADAA